jgi:hypothetical protein
VFRHLALRIRNVTNPMIGCGAQQTRRTLDGGNRQGGGKPRRRNRTCPLAKASRREEPRRRKPQGFRAGVDDESPVRWRGVLWKPHERRLEKSRPGRQESVSRRGLLFVGATTSAVHREHGRPLESLKSFGRTMKKPHFHTPCPKSRTERTRHRVLHRILHLSSVL